METAHKIPADQLSPIKDSATHLKEMVWHEQFWLRISHRGYTIHAFIPTLRSIVLFTMAMQTELCMQFPWDTAADTTGTPAELPTLVLHSGTTVFFPVMAMFVVPESAFTKEVQMMFVAVLNFP